MEKYQKQLEVIQDKFSKGLISQNEFRVESMKVFKEAKQKPNETCNCGSGKKFKKCCGRNGDKIVEDPEICLPVNNNIDYTKSFIHNNKGRHLLDPNNCPECGAYWKTLTQNQKDRFEKYRLNYEKENTEV